ncbi:hypothetical protein L873DRAFT_1477015 [Choiromyces venosus 120613-1]|uniref:Uncharacterized protein n=1 Tax=Choiromyces venosus 120613-1 TaxID=1336337 RepID=A0A3N4JJZ3_9PEZI|nr:hypothetical protein L873DRAFT_1477015 [Choiromyces venosus 120613-1]
MDGWMDERMGSDDWSRETRDSKRWRRERGKERNDRTEWYLGPMGWLSWIYLFMSRARGGEEVEEEMDISAFAAQERKKNKRNETKEKAPFTACAVCQSVSANKQS